MSAPNTYLAFDLGAESGRAILGRLDDRRLALSEVHRFANTPVYVPELIPGQSPGQAPGEAPGKARVSLQWDILHLLAEIKAGLGLAVNRHGRSISSLGIDTWGVDFGLLDRSGSLIGNPTHYRDSRTDGMIEEAYRRMPRAEIYARTGIQFLTLNSLYQLLALVLAQSPSLEIARTFLTVPSLLNYWLTGVVVNEFTHATTTQCYNPALKDWDRELLTHLGIPGRIFTEIVPPGTNLGALLPSVTEEVGLGGQDKLAVIAPATHDTGSAVAAVPAEKAGFCWISSGTWSVVGAEWPTAVINEKSLAYNFTNEGGVGDTYRFSRNVMGLWILQECRRTWAGQGEELSYSDLARMAVDAAPFQAVIDPDHAEFFKPGDMPQRIHDFCLHTGQAAPEGKAAVVRCVLESLALKYRWVLERLEEMLGQRLEPIHIVGGGTQNQVLSQFTADATGRRVIAGPIEATAIGNILMQAIALSHLSSIAEARSVVRASFPLDSFTPSHTPGWDAAYQTLLTLTG